MGEQAHLNFTPTAAGLKPFRKELEKATTTRNMLQIPYDKPLPEDLIRKIARQCVRSLGERQDDNFWS